MSSEWGVRSVSVPAEWALYGKQAGDYEGYRVLACSEGPVSRSSFEEAIGTFNLGTPEELPQVGVSYLAPAGQPDRYLALSICDDSAAQRDANGRAIAYTRYFCAPYRDLFQAKIGYLALYQAFQGAPLPSQAGAGLLAQVPVLPLPTHSGGPRAAHVAALLLTGRSVCVTGAEQVPVLDRLRFIDSVMSLLPYSLRAKMSAATWTRSTTQHRFRLSFSDTPRTDLLDGREPDLAVTWDGPEQAQIPPQYGFVRPYIDWLARNMRAPVDWLADYEGETGFGSTNVLAMLDKLKIEVPGRWRPGPPPPQGRPQQPGPPTPPRAPAGPLPNDHVTRILIQINDKVTTGNVRGLKADVAAVASTVKNHEEKYGGQPLEERRRHFQDVIVQHQLLRPDVLAQLDRDARSFCRSLLKLGFGLPISYAGYCLLEDMLAGSPTSLPEDVLQVIHQAGMPDPRVAVIVLSFYEEDEQRKWFSKGHVQVDVLVDALSERWDRASHARMACDALLWHLSSVQGKAVTPEVRDALQFRGYLAPVLAARYPEDLQYQVDALRTFLLAAYGGRGFGKDAVVETLRNGRHVPTPALLGAVLTLVDPADQAMVDLARESYFVGSILRAGFGPDMEAKLMRCVFPEGPQDHGTVSDPNATKPLDPSLQPPRPDRRALPAAGGPPQSPADPAQQPYASADGVRPAAYGDHPPGRGTAWGLPVGGWHYRGPK